MRAVRPANKATECVVLTSCSATKCSPMSVAPCAIICFCFFRLSWMSRHSPVDTNPTNLVPSRSATHLGTGSGYSRCPSGMGVGKASPSTSPTRASPARAPPSCRRASTSGKGKSGATAPVHHSCSDDDDEPARRAGAVSRRFWWREMNDVAGLVSSTRATRRDTERITHVITTLTVLADASPESRSRASSPTQPPNRGVIFAPSRECPATGRCCTSPPSRRG